MSEDDPQTDRPFGEPFGEPFSYRETQDGLLQLSRAGKLVTTLRGKKAQNLLQKITGADARSAQLLMAKATGNYKFGNEKAAKAIGKRRHQDRGSA